jgi:hypothetical protein
VEYGIQDLTRLTKELLSLLENPEPGLFGWRKALHDKILTIAMYSGDEDVIKAIQRKPKSYV